MESKINIKKILEKEGQVRKFVGVAPEGFILVHEKTIEDLKDFEIWKEWKNGFLSINEMNKSNFNDT
jgi:hypothetical protein